MKSPTSLERLIEALRVLPGVGPKSAQRMAYHLLQRDRNGAARLGQMLEQALVKLQHCEKCNDLTEDTLCAVCASAERNPAQLAVVEMPADLMMMEQTQSYNGLYFVLMGRLSPLDGLGPEELGLAQLTRRLGEGEIEELIIATNPTVEGEATAHYLAQLARAGGVRPTRLAHGVPLGGELEYVDRSTLAHAFGGRQLLD